MHGRDRINQFAELIVLLTVLAIILMVAFAAAGCNSWHLEVAREQAETIRSCELQRDVCLDRLEKCECHEEGNDG